MGRRFFANRSKTRRARRRNRSRPSATARKLCPSRPADGGQIQAGLNRLSIPFEDAASRQGDTAHRDHLRLLRDFACPPSKARQRPASSLSSTASNPSLTSSSTHGNRRAGSGVGRAGQRHQLSDVDQRTGRQPAAAGHQSAKRHSDRYNAARRLPNARRQPHDAGDRRCRRSASRRRFRATRCRCRTPPR